MAQQDLIRFNLGDGWDRLERALLQFPEEIARKVLGKAVLRGAQVVAVAAAMMAPRSATGKKFSDSRGVRPAGFLARSIRARKSSQRIGLEQIFSTGAVRYVVGPSAAAFYGRFSEHGTRRQRTRPFLGPAIEHTAADALALIRSELSQGISKTARRMAREGA